MSQTMSFTVLTPLQRVNSSVYVHRTGGRSICADTRRPIPLVARRPSRTARFEHVRVFATAEDEDDKDKQAKDVSGSDLYPIPSSNVDWNAEWKRFIETGAVSKVKESEMRGRGRKLPQFLVPVKKFADSAASRVKRSFSGTPSSTAIIILVSILVISFWLAFVDQSSQLAPPNAGFM
mmetsp:Transcript_5263/g.8679  ORF Transcript_5263/g.8679 Transcript_5263/m.8679 type:complete len:178 (+) Transcript_5263:89-622(+)